MNKEYKKIGYLNHNYKMFHLIDNGLKKFEYHYHDFDKILILIKGDISYHIEGKTYKLKPYDVVLVNAYEVHKPEINNESCYERIIIYVSPKFIDSYKEEKVDLAKCFVDAKEKKSNILRISSFNRTKLYSIINELENTFNQNNLYANELYQRILFLQFMIELNRCSINKEINYIETNYSNKKILSIIDYINNNLSADLSIESIASLFYLSKSYLMHSFKKETGFTINNYVKTKRLLYAKSLIRQGKTITEACYQCGYNNYSTFSRAYKKTFGMPARKEKM